jgi:antibiotic biosynthesis monooxygenase
VILRVARTRIRDGHDVDVLDVVRQLTTQFGAIPGLRSARFGRAVQAEGWSLISVTEWESLAAIQAVYGDGWAESTLLPGVEAFILETTVEHFEGTLEDVTAIVDTHAHELTG